MYLDAAAEESVIICWLSLTGLTQVPMEEMEGRIQPGQHRHLVESAAAAHMNMIRVWGGGEQFNARIAFCRCDHPIGCMLSVGIYPLDEWLNACDVHGVMSFIDMQYSTDGVFPGVR